MTDPNQKALDKAFTKRAIDTAIRLGFIALLVFWCLLIFKPFLAPVFWAIILAVAIYPVYLKFESLLGGRKKLALTLFTLIALALLITPTIMLATSTADAIQDVSMKLEAGTLHVPQPPERVAGWPLVGEKLHKLWSGAANNIGATIKLYAPQIKEAAKWFLSTAAGAGAGVLTFIIAILIAAVFIGNAEAANQFTRSLAIRLAGDEGKDFAELAGATMRSVAQGVLGVAFIQAVLSGIGLLLMDVPAAGLWALLVLVLAVVQLPPLLILGPIIIYVFSTADTVPAVLFMIWGLFVSASDAFLKPMLLGRGLDIPMLVILIGAIGGMMLSGIIGLFVGAVVFAIGYKLFIAWLEQDFSVEEIDTSTMEDKVRP